MKFLIPGIAKNFLSVTEWTFLVSFLHFERCSSRSEMSSCRFFNMVVPVAKKHRMQSLITAASPSHIPFPCSEAKKWRCWDGRHAYKSKLCLLPSNLQLKCVCKKQILKKKLTRENSLWVWRNFDAHPKVWQHLNWEAQLSDQRWTCSILERNLLYKLLISRYTCSVQWWTKSWFIKRELCQIWHIWRVGKKGNSQRLTEEWEASSDRKP